MPIVEVTHNPHVAEEQLRHLSSVLPHAVSVAVECPEEPYDDNLRPGDVDIRFRARGPLDTGGLALVVHVHSKWFQSRAVDREVRCERLRDAIAAEVGDLTVGVYLSLPVAGWAQTD
jgi:hypothetical protein